MTPSETSGSGSNYTVTMTHPATPTVASHTSAGEQIVRLVVPPAEEKIAAHVVEDEGQGKLQIDETQKSPIKPTVDYENSNKAEAGGGEKLSEKKTQSNVGSKKSASSKPGKYYCKYCGRTCAKPSVLEKHLRAHTNERPFPCVACGISFKTKSNLSKHCKSNAHVNRTGISMGSSLEAINSVEEREVEGTEDNDNDNDSEGTDTDVEGAGMEEVENEEENCRGDDGKTSMVENVESGVGRYGLEQVVRKEVVLEGIRQKVGRRQKLKQEGVSTEKSEMRDNTDSINMSRRFQRMFTTFDKLSDVDLDKYEQVQSFNVANVPNMKDNDEANKILNKLEEIKEAFQKRNQVKGLNVLMTQEVLNDNDDEITVRIYKPKADDIASQSFEIKPTETSVLTNIVSPPSSSAVANSSSVQQVWTIGSNLASNDNQITTTEMSSHSKSQHLMTTSVESQSQRPKLSSYRSDMSAGSLQLMFSEGSMDSVFHSSMGESFSEAPTAEKSTNKSASASQLHPSVSNRNPTLGNSKTAAFSNIGGSEDHGRSGVSSGSVVASGTSSPSLSKLDSTDKMRIQEHIQQIISTNAAIVDQPAVLDPWRKQNRYMRQASDSSFHSWKLSEHRNSPEASSSLDRSEHGLSSVDLALDVSSWKRRQANSIGGNDSGASNHNHRTDLIRRAMSTSALKPRGDLLAASRQNSVGSPVSNTSERDISYIPLLSSASSTSTTIIPVTIRHSLTASLLSGAQPKTSTGSNVTKMLSQPSSEEPLSTAMVYPVNLFSNNASLKLDGKPISSPPVLSNPISQFTSTATLSGPVMTQIRNQKQLPQNSQSTIIRASPVLSENIDTITSISASERLSHSNPKFGSHSQPAVTVPSTVPTIVPGPGPNDIQIKIQLNKNVSEVTTTTINQQNQQQQVSHSDTLPLPSTSLTVTSQSKIQHNSTEFSSIIGSMLQAPHHSPSYLISESKVPLSEGILTKETISPSRSRGTHNPISQVISEEEHHGKQGLPVSLPMSSSHFKSQGLSDGLAAAASEYVLSGDFACELCGENFSQKHALLFHRNQQSCQGKGLHRSLSAIEGRYTVAKETNSDESSTPNDGVDCIDLIKRTSPSISKSLSAAVVERGRRMDINSSLDLKDDSLSSSSLSLMEGNSESKSSSLQPRKKGRPKGSKNRPKDLNLVIAKAKQAQSISSAQLKMSVIGAAPSSNRLETVGQRLSTEALPTQNQLLLVPGHKMILPRSSSASSVSQALVVTPGVNPVPTTLASVISLSTCTTAASVTGQPMVSVSQTGKLLQQLTKTGIGDSMESHHQQTSLQQQQKQLQQQQLSIIGLNSSSIALVGGQTSSISSIAVHPGSASALQAALKPGTPLASPGLAKAGPTFMLGLTGVTLATPTTPITPSHISFKQAFRSSSSSSIPMGEKAVHSVSSGGHPTLNIGASQAVTSDLAGVSPRVIPYIPAMTFQGLDGQSQVIASPTISSASISSATPLGRFITSKPNQQQFQINKSSSHNSSIAMTSSIDTPPATTESYPGNTMQRLKDKLLLRQSLSVDKSLDKNSSSIHSPSPSESASPTTLLLKSAGRVAKNSEAYNTPQLLYYTSTTTSANSTAQSEPTPGGSATSLPAPSNLTNSVLVASLSKPVMASSHKLGGQPNAVITSAVMGGKVKVQEKQTTEALCR